MLLSDFFTQLSYGELSSLGLSKMGQGSIEIADQPKVVAHINSALALISKKIPYKQCYVKLAASTARNTYLLQPEFAVSNTDPGNTAPRYIIDSVDELFKDNVVKIREITRLDRADTPNVDETLITSINKRSTDSGFGARVIGTSRIILEQPLDGDVYEVEYQAQADKLSMSVDPDEVIDIPGALEQALELATAARVFGSIGNETATMKSQELWARYRAELAELSANDNMSQTETDGFDKLRDKGFV